MYSTSLILQYLRGSVITSVSVVFPGAWRWVAPIGVLIALPEMNPKYTEQRGQRTKRTARERNPHQNYIGTGQLPRPHFQIQTEDQETSPASELDLGSGHQSPFWISSKVKSQGIRSGMKSHPSLRFLGLRCETRSMK